VLNSGHPPTRDKILTWQKFFKNFFLLVLNYQIIFKNMILKIFPTNQIFRATFLKFSKSKSVQKSRCGTALEPGLSGKIVFNKKCQINNPKQICFDNFFNIFKNNRKI